MTRIFGVAALALLFAAAADLPRASAQPQVPGGGTGSRPTFSPYLNLLGGGRSPGLNYLGIVRPQQQLNQQLNQLQQQLTVQNGTINDGSDPSQSAFLPTGNVAVFNSTGGYFNRIPGITSGGSSGGGFTGGFNRPLGTFAGGGLGGGMGNASSGRVSAPRGGGRR